MVLAHDVGVKDSRRGVKGIHSRIDTELRNLTREHRRGVQEVERRGRSRVGKVVGRHIDGLHRSDTSLLGGRDTLLEVTHLGCERRLITYGRGHTAEKGRHL